MKAYFWISVVVLLTITGCAANNAKKHTQEEVLRIRSLAEAYLAEKKYVPAYRELIKARELDPNDPHVYYDLGIFYYEKNKLLDAIENYQKALSLEPDFATARNNLGVVYLELKEWDRAIETLMPITEDYLYATPHFPHFLIGQAYFYKADFQHAREHFEACLELQPSFPFAAHWLGKTLIKLGQPEEAVIALKEAIKVTPAAVFQLDLGRAYIAAGNPKKANEAFGKALSLATDNNLKKEILQEQQQLRDKTSRK